MSSLFTLVVPHLTFMTAMVKINWVYSLTHSYFVLYLVNKSVNESGLPTIKKKEKEKSAYII